MLPVKRRRLPCSSSVAWRIRASPLPVSSPMRQQGHARGSTRRGRARRRARPCGRTGRGCGPSNPASPRCRAGRAGPDRVIIWTARAGRSTPGARPRRRIAAATPAPVWPAVTTASARPVLTRRSRDQDGGVLLARAARARDARASPRPGWRGGRSRWRERAAGERRGRAPRRRPGSPRRTGSPRRRRRARDDLVRAVVAAHRVDREADPAAALDPPDGAQVHRCSPCLT